MSTQDASLIERAKSGDPEAFRMIYEESYPKIYSYVYYRVSTKELAEDISAEVFVRLVKKIDTYQDRGRPLLAWLYTIAGNLIRDHYRRANHVEWSSIDDDSNYHELADDEDETDPSQFVDLQLKSDQLIIAIRQLTEEQSQVIIMKFVQGWNNKEIAAALGKPEGSIKSLQYRALRSLKRIIVDQNLIIDEL